jgi:hypothetical protein
MGDLWERLAIEPPLFGRRKHDPRQQMTGESDDSVHGEQDRGTRERAEAMVAGAM